MKGIIEQQTAVRTVPEQRQPFRKGVILTPADLTGCAWPERLARRGLNTLGIHSGGGPAHDIFTALGDTATPDFRRQLHRLGLECEYENHASIALLPRELYGEQPESFPFSWKQNRRLPTGNWCISSAFARKQIARNAVRLAEALPSPSGRWFFWGEDTGDCWCHCDGCSRFSPADQALYSVNLIADTLREHRPEARVAYLAYLETLDMPEVFRPHAGVFLEYAPYFRCYRHALDDSSCRINRRHLDILRQLLEVFDPAETQVLEYWLDSSLYCFEKRKPRARPIFRPEVVERDLRLYTGLGIRSITTFAVNMDAEYFSEFGEEELTVYARLLNGFR